MGRLNPNSIAPLFTAQTSTGAEIKLADCIGHKIWLCFYRYATCPICQVQLQRIIEDYEVFQNADAKVITVMESKMSEFPPEMGGTSQVPFPMIADPEKKLYALYGLQKSMMGMLKPQTASAWLKAQSMGFRQGRMTGEFSQMPAQFLIREDGTIHTAYYGTHAADDIPWFEVQKFIKESRFKF